MAGGVGDQIGKAMSSNADVPRIKVRIASGCDILRADIGLVAGAFSAPNPWAQSIGHNAARTGHAIIWSDAA